MKKIMNYVKSFVIAAMVLTSGNVWGLEFNTSVLSNVSGDIDNLGGGKHVSSFYIECLEKDSKKGKFENYTSWGNKKLTIHTAQLALKWIVESGYNINVTSVEINGERNSLDNYTFTLEGSSSTLVNKSGVLTGSVSKGNDGAVSMSISGGAMRIQGIKITYTVTPDAPVRNFDSQTIQVTETLDSKNTLDLSTVFSKPTTIADASHISIAYNSDGGVIEGDKFYAQAAGTYHVTAKILSADCHSESANSTACAITVNGKSTPTFTQNISNVSTNKVYNLSDFVSSNNNTTDFALSITDQSKVKIVENKLYVYGSTGSFTIHAEQEGNENWYEKAEDFTVTISAAPATCWTPETKAAGNYYLLNSKYNAQNNFLKATSEITTNPAEATLFTFSGTSSTTISYTEGETTKYITQNRGTQTWGTSSASWSIVEASAEDINNLGQGSGWKFTNRGGDSNDRHLSINNAGVVNYIKDGWNTNFYVWNYISENQMKAHLAYTTLTDYVGTKSVSTALKDVAVETMSANDCESATEYGDKATNLQAVIDAYDAYAEVEEYIANSSAPAEKITEAKTALAVSTTASEILAIKSMLKLEPDFAYNGGTLKVDATSSFVLTNVDVETLEVAITNNTPTGITDGSEHADEIIAYDQATNTLYAYNAGTAHIVLRQPETEALYADEAAFDITVEKYTNTITLNGATDYNITLAYNDSKTLTLASDNAAVVLTTEQTSGTDEVAFDSDALTVTSNYRDGAAAIAVSQDEDYKYAAAEATINVTVAAGTDPVCYVLEVNEYKAAHTTHHDFELSGPGETLSFQMRREGTELGSAYAATNINNWERLPEFDKTENVTRSISENATHIRLGHDGSQSVFFDNVKVTRKNFVRADKSELVTPVALVNQPVVVTFDLQYSTSEGDDILLASENPKFVLSKERVSTSACSQGTETITVTYTSDKAGTDEGNIIIYNHNHRYILPVSGTTRGKLQTHLVYAGEDSYDEHSVYDAEGNLKGIENPFLVYDENDELVENTEIVMTSANEAILEVSQNMLIPYCGGNVNLTASYAGDDTYAPATNLTKTIYVAECEATIAWTQTFRNFTSPTDNGKEIALTPVLRDKDGNDLNATFSFTTGNAEVAAIVSENVLRMVGNGRTIVTASTTTQYTDSKSRIYAAASLDKEVRMRPYDAPCESNYIDWSGSQKAEGSTYAEWTWENASGDLIDANRDASFTAHISFWATRGTFKTYQQVEGDWTEVHNSGKPAQNTTGIVTCRLATNATGFRVEFSGIGLGSCTVYDLNVPMKTYMTADKATIEASKDVNKTYLSEITVRYSDIPTLKAEVTDLNVIEGETGTLSIEATEEVKNDCGEYGSYSYQLSGTFIKEGEVTAHVHFFTDANTEGIVIPVTLTITEPDIYEPGCTNCNITWDGSSRPNFEDEVHLSDNVNVVVNGDVTVKGLTIDEGSSVTITVNGHLTIEDAPSVEQNAYGDLIIEKGGWITINGTGTTQVRNLEFNTVLGNRFTAAQSAQLELADDEYLNVNGDMYIDITFDPRPADELTPADFFGSYDFTVPFPVNANSGIYYVDAEGHETALRFGVDYLIASFSESGRAKNQKCWINYTGILQPSVGYTITIDSDHPEWNTLRFRKVAGAALNHEKSLNLVQSTQGTATDHGWNCIGNGTSMHAFVQAAYSGGAPYVQVYDHTANNYVPMQRDQYNFVVASSFFIQATTNNSTLIFEQAHNDVGYLAPARVTTLTSVQPVQLIIRETDANVMADQIFLSASDDAVNSYEIGRDLLKLGDVRKSSFAQIWGTSYGSQLAATHLPLTTGQATFPISIYAPKAGQYILEQVAISEDYDVYLLYQGYITWDLSMSGYTMTLPQGTASDYSIQLVRKQPSTPTNLTEQDAENAGVRKILVGEQIYIIKDGMIFDALGKKM